LDTPKAKAGANTPLSNLPMQKFDLTLGSQINLFRLFDALPTTDTAKVSDAGDAAFLLNPITKKPYWGGN